jgi:hypothetical protein
MVVARGPSHVSCQALAVRHPRQICTKEPEPRDLIAPVSVWTLTPARHGADALDALRAPGNCRPELREPSAKDPSVRAVHRPE